MNLIMKKCIGLCAVVIVLLPACSSRHPMTHVIDTHVSVKSSEKDGITQRVSVKKSKRLLKKRNRRPIIGTIKTLSAYIVGSVALVLGSIGVLFGIHEPASAMAPLAISLMYGVGAYQLGKSGHQDLTGQRDLDSL